MFTPEFRGALKQSLIELGKSDLRVTGVAITGSATIGQEDEWSDIDLAFGVAGDIDLVIEAFTGSMSEAGAIHHFDVPSGAWIYRVFVLSNSLQVDLAFAPETEFGARAATFKLVSGTSNDIERVAPVGPQVLVDWGVLYALHVRSSLKRGRSWQALHMLDAMREQTISLLCLRHDLPSREGRGVDRLPAEQREILAETLVADLSDLLRAFRALVPVFLNEVRHHSAEFEGKLKPVFSLLLS